MINLPGHKLDENRLDAISVLGLAHLGDAVYELLIRGWMCVKGRLTSRDLHRETVSYVSAGAQARAARRLLDKLTGQELAVFRRGRNAHVKSIPQSADPADYHAATGLEALFGWLYLRGEAERLYELFDLIVGDEHAS